MLARTHVRTALALIALLSCSANGTSESQDGSMTGNDAASDNDSAMTSDGTTTADAAGVSDSPGTTMADASGAVLFEGGVFKLWYGTIFRIPYSGYNSNYQGSRFEGICMATIRQL